MDQVYSDGWGDVPSIDLFAHCGETCLCDFCHSGMVSGEVGSMSLVVIDVLVTKLLTHPFLSHSLKISKPIPHDYSNTRCDI